MDAETAQHIREAFWVGIGFTLVVSCFFYLSHRSAEGAPTRWAKWKAFLAARCAERHSYTAAHVMSGDNGTLPIVQSSAVPGGGPYPGPTPVPERNLTEDRVFRDTVLLRTAQGKWAHSGKRLYAFWGGNHDELLAKIRDLRGEIEPETAPPDLMLTPFAGRPTRASYYPGEPDLEYSPPD